MFEITVKGKVHKIEKVTPRALYEMQPALEMFNRINQDTQKALKGEDTAGGPEAIKQALDVLMAWFVIFCGNKFSKEDLLDGYQADSILIDIGVALRACQTGMTEAITAFPMTARLPKPPRETAAAETAPTRASVASRCKSTLIAWTKGWRRK